MQYENLHRFGLLIVVGFLLLVRYTGMGNLLTAGIRAVATPYFTVAENVAQALGA